MSALLPPEFADLERFAAEWALPSMDERYRRRLRGTMDEMQEFYDAAVPRGPEAIAYCNQFPLDDMPEPALRLLWLLASLSTVSFAIDVFKQPKIPSAGDGYLPYVREFVP